MYDQGFRNQAVKECVNGSSLRGTAKKYGISECALRGWIKEYKKNIAIMETTGEAYIEPEPVLQEVIPAVSLSAVKINIDGNDITLERHVVERLMDIFNQYDK